MWYDEYFRKGNVFQLHEDDAERHEYEQALLAQNIKYREVMFTTPCGEDYIAILLSSFSQ